MNKVKKILSYVLIATMMLSSFSFADTVTSRTDFTDTEGHWAEKSIDRWADEDVVHGYPEGDYRPDNFITRAEFAQVIVNLLSLHRTTDLHYIDIDLDEWYIGALGKSVYASLLNGYPDNTIHPNGFITREEASAIIARVFGLADEEYSYIKDFTDARDISGWASGGIAALVKYGSINGYEDNSFRPKRNISRAETAKILDRMISRIIKEDNAKVTLKDGEFVLVAAKNVSLTGKSNGIVITAKADNSTTKLNGVTLDAFADYSDSSIDVDKSNIKRVDMSGATAGGKIDFDKDTTVGTLVMKGDDSTADVWGKIGDVDVDDTATNVTVNIHRGGTVDKITDDGTDTTINIETGANVGSIGGKSPTSGDNTPSTPSTPTTPSGGGGGGGGGGGSKYTPPEDERTPEDMQSLVDSITSASNLTVKINPHVDLIANPSLGAFGIENVSTNRFPVKVTIKNILDETVYESPEIAVGSALTDASADLSKFTTGTYIATFSYVDMTGSAINGGVGVRVSVIK